MEFLGDMLEKLLPLVFLVSTFLLPAFLKKKKEQKKNKSFMPPPPGKADKGGGAASLEEKIKRQFDRIRSDKKRAAQKTPKSAPQAGMTTRPPASRPSLAEPLRPSLSRPPAQAKTRPPVQKRPSPAFPGNLGSSPVEDAYRIERNIHGEKSDIPAFEDAKSAFSKTRLSEKRKPLATQLIPFGVGDAPLSAPLKALDDRSGDDYGQSEPDADEALKFDVGNMTRRDLRRAIVLKEIIGRPVALKGFCSEQLW